MLLDWANDITIVHNKLAEGKDFEAGWLLCFVEQCMFDAIKKLEKE